MSEYGKKRVTGGPTSIKAILGQPDGVTFKVGRTNKKVKVVWAEEYFERGPESYRIFCHECENEDRTAMIDYDLSSQKGMFRYTTYEHGAGV